MGSVSGIFRQIQALFKSILARILNLLYPCQIKNSGISLSQRIFRHIYVHDTILNIFAKAPSWTLGIVLSVSLLQILSNFSFNFTVSLILYFRHIQAYSTLNQAYLVLLRHIKNPGIFRTILLRVYSKSYAHHIGRFKHIQIPGLFSSVMLQAYSAIFKTSGILRYIFAQIWVYFGRLTYIQSPGTVEDIQVY